MHVTLPTRRRLALALGCAALAALPPTVAYAASYNYVTNITLPGHSAAASNDWAPRQFQNIWRPLGYATKAEYLRQNGSYVVSASNSSNNPFYWGVSIAYGQALCLNATASSVSPYTCQTTR